MNTKLITTIFSLGIFLIIAGSLFKLLHWMFAPELFITGIALLVISIILFVIKKVTN